MVNTVIYTRESDEEVKQVKVGNFAVDGTMQPGPLLGFGQNIIDPHNLLLELAAGWLTGPHKRFNEVVPYFVYGFPKDFSLLVAFPVLHLKEDGYRSSGAGDIAVQFEHAFYAHHTPTFTNQFTFVTSMYFPSGRSDKNPSTGFGSPSFFLGVTAEHLATEWYYYTSYGALLTTQHDHSKAGNQFSYQAGIGKNIAYRPEKWILTLMVEMNGLYEQQEKVDCIKDENSGFNRVLIGPTLWFSTQRFFIEAGGYFVAVEHLFGKQPKSSAFFLIDMGFRFGS